MKPKQNIFNSIFMFVLLIGVYYTRASETSYSIQWNDAAQSTILNVDELNKIGNTFPSWQIKQVTWPSSSEILTNAIAVDPNLKSECMKWLSKFIKSEQLPVELDKHLIAMKGWGVITKESEQKRLCDVFIVRYKIGDYFIHIQESPYNVIIAIVDESLSKSPRTDHTSFITEITQTFLNGSLKPNSDPNFFHVNKIDKQGKINRISWIPEKVGVVNKNGRTCISSGEAWKIGTTGIKAETDGRFVKFDIVKSIKGPRLAPDPYVERFGTKK